VNRKSWPWLRSVLAVVGGFAATFVLSVITDLIFHAMGLYPPPGQSMSPWLFGVAALYRAAFTVVGGYTTAWLAPGRPMIHAGILAGIGLLAGSAGALANSGGAPAVYGPPWYALSIPASAIPCVLGGAWLWTHRRQAAS
jgi:hypothetical protein